MFRVQPTEDTECVVGEIGRIKTTKVVATCKEDIIAGYANK